MAVSEALSDEEACLVAILTDQSGLDLAEFTWYDPESPDGCWRARPYQWAWWRDEHPMQIDQCVAAGQLVLTTRGHVPIEEVLVGDEVLTHHGRWRPVTAVWDRGERPVVKVQGQGHPGLVVTPDHPLWARRARRASRPRDGHTGKKLLASEWLAPADWEWSDGSGVMQANWGTPVVIAASCLPDQMVPAYRSGQQNLVREVFTEPWMWLYGLYLAEGSTYSDAAGKGLVYRTTWSVHEDEVPVVAAQLEKVGLRYSLDQVGRAVNVRVNSRPVTLWLRRHGGRLARGKYLAPWVFGLPEPLRRAVFDGAAYGDGWRRPESGGVAYSTTSRALAIEVRLLALSLGMSASVSVAAPSTSWIEGRPLRGRGGYVVECQNLVGQARPHVQVVDGAAWAPLRGVVDAGVARVYDLEVEEDGSFVLEGIVVHNCARDVGKTTSIVARANAFPFCRPSGEMVVTAPELVHLTPLTDAIERVFHDTRLGTEIMPRGRSKMIRRPFRMNFTTGARIIGRIPQVTGRAVKGLHPVALEMDEAQDYPEAGWTELTATLRKGIKGAIWRAHGVTRGYRDKFFEYTQPGPRNPWKIHRIVAMHRDDWSDEERQLNIELRGSREAPDYRRDILGLHGDPANALFVLSRLIRCVDSEEGSEYNADQYRRVMITGEQLEELSGFAQADQSPEEEDQGWVARQALAAIQLLDFTDIADRYMHPNGTPGVFWGGMDVGFTIDPSEILIAAEYQPDREELRADRKFHRATPEKGVTRLRVVARIQMKRVSNPVQVAVVAHIIRQLGIRAFGLDKMQPVSEPILTPQGWAPIGSLAVGDQVIGSNGRPTLVTGVFPQHDRRVMRVTCTDGSWTRCGPEHLWTVKHTQHKASKVMTTEALAPLVNRDGSHQWTIPMLSAPVEPGTSVSLPLDPYLLGALLGDGNCRENSTRFSSVDAEILAEVEARLPEGHVLKHTDRCNYILAVTSSRDSSGRFDRSNVVLARLKDLGLAGKRSFEKHVPTLYMTAGASDRLLLLQGIMDTDGWVGTAGYGANIGIRSSSERLVQDVISLVESLGGWGRYHPHATSCQGKPGRMAYRATLAMPPGVNPFRLARKREGVQERTKYAVKRYIASIVPDGEEESVCIRVDAADELYVTRHHLLTHNTGNGIGLFMDLQALDPAVASVVRGYNFSEKVIVGIDGTVEITDQDDVLKEAALKSNVLEFSTDKLRELVDRNRWMMAFDRDVIKEFQGQTWAWSKALNAMDAYGRPRRVFSKGNFHTLDAARMLAMAHAQAPIEEVVHNLTHPQHEDVVDSFL